MMKNKAVFLTLFFFLASLMMACSSQYAGGSSDTEIVGYLFVCDSSEGAIVDRHTPLTGAVVSLLKSGAHPIAGDTLPIDTTDVNGRYSFAEVTSGSYHIYFEKKELNLSGVVDVEVDIEEPVVVQDQYVEKTGALAITPTVEAFEVGGRLIIEGTPLEIEFDAGVSPVIFPDVPANSPLAVHSFSHSGESFHYPGLHYVSPEDTTAVYHMAKVLYVVDTLGGGDSISKVMATAIQGAQLEVTVKSIQDFLPEDTANADVIYFAPEVDSLSAYTAIIKELNIPLLVASSDLYPLLGMTSEVEYGRESVTDMVIQQQSFSPLLDTMSSGTAVSLYETGTTVPDVEWGNPTAVSPIGASGGLYPDRDYLFFYPQGALLEDGTTAISGRVGIFGSSNGTLNTTGTELVYRTLLFLAEQYQVF